MMENTEAENVNEKIFKQIETGNINRDFICTINHRGRDKMNAIEKLCRQKTPAIFEDRKAGFFLICPHDSHRCAQLREEAKQTLKGWLG